LDYDKELTDIFYMKKFHITLHIIIAEQQLNICLSVGNYDTDIIEVIRQIKLYYIKFKLCFLMTKNISVQRKLKE
jgi:hypothetical protein